MLKRFLEWFRKGPDEPLEPSDVELELRRMNQRITQIELEWGDVLDKMLAREERNRKRDKKAVEQQIEPPPDLFNQPKRRLLGGR